MTNAAAPFAGRVNNHPILDLAPGLALTAGITLAAYGLRYIPGVDKLSPMILAILIGAVIHNTMGNPAAMAAGINFSLRRILRFSIILIGLQITAQQAAEVGLGGVAIIAAGLLCTLVATMAMGRLLGVASGLSLLIGVGASICGASAILAAKTATG